MEATAFYLGFWEVLSGRVVTPEDTFISAETGQVTHMEPLWRAAVCGIVRGYLVVGIWEPCWCQRLAECMVNFSYRFRSMIPRSPKA
jgi:hypothetical protein